MLFLLLLALIVLTVLLLFKHSERPQRFPPGPNGIPLLGYLPFLPCTPQPITSAIPKLVREYGAIVGFYLGPFQPIVVVTGLKAVKEALCNDDLDGRPDNKLVKALTFGKRLGIATTDGELWREQRNFTQRKLKDLIFEKTTLEDRAISEILTLLTQLKSLSQSANDIADFEDLLFVPVINVLWDSLCGMRFRHDDGGKTREVLKTASEFNKRVCQAQFMLPLPNLIVRLLRLRPEEKICNPVDIIQPVQNLIKETIREHQQKRKQPDYCSWDFIDHYLDEVEQKGDGSSYSIEQLAALIQDLFIAGSDTTSNQIGFALIHLINCPDVQRKMQEELDDVCGDRLPSLNDRPRLPYTEAVLRECNRLSPVSTAALLHRAIRDTHLENFFIPKDSLLFIQLREENGGAGFWTDHDTFQPERHLQHLNGSSAFIKKETFLPFGAGKRMCPGKTMGEAMYFLFVASIVKVFFLRLLPSEIPPTLEPCYSMIASYQGFKARVTPRCSF